MAHQRNADQFTAIFPLGGHLSVNFFQIVLKLGDDVANDPPVGLDLLLPRAPHSDTPSLSLKVGPHSGESRQQVLVLGQLYLGFGMGRAGTTGKDVENQVGPVEDATLKYGLDVLQLRGRKLVVENYAADFFVHL